MDYFDNLGLIITERIEETVPLSTQYITKYTEELINVTAEKLNVHFDVAMELLIRLGDQKFYE